MDKSYSEAERQSIVGGMQQIYIHEVKEKWLLNGLEQLWHQSATSEDEAWESQEETLCYPALKAITIDKSRFLAVQANWQGSILK